MFDDLEIEVTKEFKYLGICFTRGGAFDKAKKHIVEQGNKAMYSLLKKIRTLNLPLDMQLELFETKLSSPYCCSVRCRSMGVWKLRYYRAGAFEISEIRIKSKKIDTITHDIRGAW